MILPRQEQWARFTPAAQRSKAIKQGKGLLGIVTSLQPNKSGEGQRHFIGWAVAPRCRNVESQWGLDFQCSAVQHTKDMVGPGLFHERSHMTPWHFQPRDSQVEGEVEHLSLSHLESDQPSCSRPLPRNPGSISGSRSAAATSAPPGVSSLARWAGGVGAPLRPLYATPSWPGRRWCHWTSSRQSASDSGWPQFR